MCCDVNTIKCAVCLKPSEIPVTSVRQKESLRYG